VNQVCLIQSIKENINKFSGEGYYLGLRGEDKLYKRILCEIDTNAYDKAFHGEKRTTAWYAPDFEIGAYYASIEGFKQGFKIGKTAREDRQT
jgi:hypothetical protein